VLEQLIAIDSVVQSIQTDVKAAKGLRAQLFQRDTKMAAGAGIGKQSARSGKNVPKDDGKGLMPVFFHLLESIMSSVNVLVERYSDGLIAQLPAEVRKKVPKAQDDGPSTPIKAKRNSEDSSKVILKLEPEKNNRKLANVKSRVDGAMSAMMNYIDMSRDFNRTQGFEKASTDAVLQKLVIEMKASPRSQQ
jgi:hypothetical protein